MSNQNEKPEPKVGVYICHCGSNIAGVVDCASVAEYAATIPGVVSSRHYAYMCSEPGQALIKEDIKKLGVNRVVVASCTPRMHEPTYRKVLEECGVNPFFFEMANIREHVSWAHQNQKAEATEKAKDLVKMAVARAKKLEAVSKMEVGVIPNAVVLGGGIGGITTTLDLAAMGFKVTLVEREPYLGGNTAMLNKLYWGGEVSNTLKSYYEKLAASSTVTILTGAEVAEHIEGYIGNFTLSINQKPKFVDEKCNNCGKCIEVCPVSMPNNFNYGLDQRKAIYKPFKVTYPDRYAIDEKACTKCGKCAEVCPQKAVNLDAKPMDLKIPTGTVIVATGFEPYVPEGEFGFGKSKDVITTLQLERMLNPDGPTKGKLLRPSNGTAPKSVTFIMCVGSRQEKAHMPAAKTTINPYCSRYCCASALKNAILIKEQLPETEVYVMYRDIRTFGRQQEEIYRKARQLGIGFLRYKLDEQPEVTTNGNAHVLVKDTLFGNKIDVESDMVILTEAMVPRHDVVELNAKLSITRSPDGFFQEQHPKMNPLDTFADGIFMGGTAQGPKDIIDTISQSSGAAAKASIPLSNGKVRMDLMTSVVDKDTCIGCGRCVDVCPYKALTLNPETKVVDVTEVKCKGCGSCAATCPTGAAQLRHYKDGQIYAMVESLAEK